MKISKTFYSLVICLLLITPAQAFIHTIKKLINPATGKSVILMSDTHVTRGEHDHQAVHLFIESLKKVDHDIQILLEDAERSQDSPFSQFSLQEIVPSSFLEIMSKQLLHTDLKIPCVAVRGIDCRCALYLFTTFLSIYKDLSIDGFLHMPVGINKLLSNPLSNIPLYHLLQTPITILKHLIAKTNNKPVKNIFKKHLELLLERKKALLKASGQLGFSEEELLHLTANTIAKAITNKLSHSVTALKYLKLCELGSFFENYQVEIVEMTALYHIAGNPFSRKTTIVIAGSAHTDNLAKILIRLGYKCTNSQSSDEELNELQEAAQTLFEKKLRQDLLEAESDFYFFDTTKDPIDNFLIRLDFEMKGYEILSPSTLQVLSLQNKIYSMKKALPVEKFSLAWLINDQPEPTEASSQPQKRKSHETDDGEETNAKEPAFVAKRTQPSRNCKNT